MVSLYSGMQLLINMFLDHIAVLTADLQRQSDALPAFCRKGAIESFPKEGTQEQYVALTKHSPKLLLLQPIAAGPYARALKKRGPGLHHLGVKTPSIQALVPQLCEQGLLLHPISIQTLAQGVVWLCRPGMTFLIEVSEGRATANFDTLTLGLPQGSHIPDFGQVLFANAQIQAAPTDQLELHVGEKQVSLPQV